MLIVVDDDDCSVRNHDVDVLLLFYSILRSRSVKVKPVVKDLTKVNLSCFSSPLSPPHSPPLLPPLPPPPPHPLYFLYRTLGG